MAPFLLIFSRKTIRIWFRDIKLTILGKKSKVLFILTEVVWENHFGSKQVHWKVAPKLLTTLNACISTIKTQINSRKKDFVLQYMLNQLHPTVRFNCLDFQLQEYSGKATSEIPILGQTKKTMSIYIHSSCKKIEKKRRKKLLLWSIFRKYIHLIYNKH